MRAPLPLGLRHQGRTWPPAARPDTTCWVDSANLNPESIYYGAGRCKPPCNDNSDCQASGNNPFGGTNLKCYGEKLTDGTDSPKRCRANGQCMDNVECLPILNLPCGLPASSKIPPVAARMKTIPISGS